MTVEAVTQQKQRLEAAYKDFAMPLTKYAFFKVHNKTLSEDLVQETFLKIWVYILKGEEIIMMKALLYRILNGLIIDEYRRQGREVYSLDLLTDKGFDVSTTDSEYQGQAIDIKTATRYIELLPKKYRDVVYMKVVLYMSTDEISNELKRTKNSVTVQIHRGFKHIKMLHQSRYKGQNMEVKV